MPVGVNTGGRAGVMSCGSPRWGQNCLIDWGMPLPSSPPIFASSSVVGIKCSHWLTHLEVGLHASIKSRVCLVAPFSMTDGCFDRPDPISVYNIYRPTRLNFFTQFPTSAPWRSAVVFGLKICENEFLHLFLYHQVTLFKRVNEATK